MSVSKYTAIIPNECDVNVQAPAPFLNASLVITGLIIFIGDCSRGILFPVLWSLCHDLQGSVVNLGYIVAMFSLGRFFVTVPLGYFCDRYRHRTSLLIANSILLLGAVLWANSYPTRKLASLYVAQFLLGCGSGSLGITRSYLAEQVIAEKRTEVLGMMTALQYAGFTVSPIIGSALSTAGRSLTYADTQSGSSSSSSGSSSSSSGSSSSSSGSSSSSSGSLEDLTKADEAADQGGVYRYWEFALPAYAIAFGAGMCILLLYAYFQDISVSPSTAPVAASSSDEITQTIRDSPTTSSCATGTDTVSPFSRPQYHSQVNHFKSTEAAMKTEKTNTNEQMRLQVVTISLLVFNVSTKGSISIYETIGARIGMLAYSLSSMEMGLLITVSGVVGFLQLLFMKPLWTTHFNDIQLTKLGVMLMTAGQLMLFSCGQASLLSVGDSSSSSSRPSLMQFVCSIVLMYAVGYPVGHTAVLGAFSKVKKSGPQAGLMGWFATAGSFARIVLPISSAHLEEVVPNGAFALILVLLSVSYLGLLWLADAIQEFTATPLATSGSEIDAAVSSETANRLSEDLLVTLQQVDQQQEEDEEATVMTDEDSSTQQQQVAADATSEKNRGNINRNDSCSCNDMFRCACVCTWIWGYVQAGLFSSILVVAILSLTMCTCCFQFSNPLSSFFRHMD